MKRRLALVCTLALAHTACDADPTELESLRPANMGVHRLKMTLALMFLLMVMSTSALAAQDPKAQRDHPTPEWCRMVANRLDSNPRSEAFRWALASGYLARCGNEGAGAIAAALRRPDVLADSAALRGLRVNAAFNRHSEIFAAAVELVEDRSAPLPARIFGLEVMLRQHYLAGVFDGSFEELATADIYSCLIISLVHGAEYISAAPLPDGYERRIVEVATRIADDDAEPASLRTLAGCVVWAMERVKGQ